MICRPMVRDHGAVARKEGISSSQQIREYSKAHGYMSAGPDKVASSAMTIRAFVPWATPKVNKRRRFRASNSPSPGISHPRR